MYLCRCRRAASGLERLMTTRLDLLEQELRARLPLPISAASQLILWPGRDEALKYSASATTTRDFDVPRGTLGIAIITSTGYTSLSVTGKTTRFPYLSVGGASTGQYLTAAWSSNP